MLLPGVLLPGALGPGTLLPGMLGPGALFSRVLLSGTLGSGALLSGVLGSGALLPGVLVTGVLTSCVRFPDRDDINRVKPPRYIYPFEEEYQKAFSEIIIETDGTVDLDKVTAEIPPLKYNKSWLFMLTQDDCRQDAFSNTWAAINGKPLSKEYFYDVDHLEAGDFPPDTYYLGKTLGSTDGAGNEVRFSFTTTLAPEWEWMNAQTSVQKGETSNYYRFFAKSGLIWDNVTEMLNFGTGIAFHDVNTESVKDVDTIVKHYAISQSIILEKLKGRGCKTLAEPNGNKTYVNAAYNYGPIQIMTAQSGTQTLYPLKVVDDLSNQLLNRGFYAAEQIDDEVSKLLKVKKEDRHALHMGVHRTSYDMAILLLWLNDFHGKDGTDSVWMPSLEEYYEYNYYRIHSEIKKKVIYNSITISVIFPEGLYFYYPSVTVNLKGLKKENIVSISTNNRTTGFSYANYSQGMMMNIDCRRYLPEHATHYVEKYEKNKTESNKNDALYFTSMLKDSPLKNSLLERIK